MNGYRPRRLRKRTVTAPEWVIKVPYRIDFETAQRIREAWLKAGRAGVAVIDSRIIIERLGR